MSAVIKKTKTSAAKLSLFCLLNLIALIFLFLCGGVLLRITGGSSFAGSLILLALSLAVFIADTIVIAVSLTSRKTRLGRFQKAGDDLLNGDVETSLEIEGKDELAVLAGNFNACLSQSRQKIQNLRETALELIDYEDDLNSAISVSFRRLTEIQDSLKQLSGLAEERPVPPAEPEQTPDDPDAFLPEPPASDERLFRLLCQADASIAGLEKILEIAEIFSVKAEEEGRGFGLLDQASHSGKGFLFTTSATVKEISVLAEEMEEIIAVIQSVANQTNLLAMNAAIEAAHAEEAGSGFTVVAGEIRGQANTTEKNSKEISKALKEVIAKIKAAVLAAEEDDRSFQRLAGELPAVLQASEALSSETNLLRGDIIRVKTCLEELKQGAAEIQRPQPRTDQLSGAAEKETETAERLEKFGLPLAAVFAEFDKVDRVLDILGRSGESLYHLAHQYRLRDDEETVEPAPVEAEPHERKTLSETFPKASSRASSVIPEAEKNTGLEVSRPQGGVFPDDEVFYFVELSREVLSGGKS